MNPQLQAFFSKLQALVQVIFMCMKSDRRRLLALRARRERMAIRYLNQAMTVCLKGRSRRRRDHARLLCTHELGANRRWWVYPRPSNWWRRFVMEFWDDEQWLQNFRMKKSTFMWIVERLKPDLQRSFESVREPLTVEERVAITLWYLANTISYCVVGQAFGVARSTVVTVVIEVCLVMESVLYKTIVRPRPPGVTMRGFMAWGYPQCVGAIDGTHIYIRAPDVDPEAFIDRKKRHSVKVQAVVDSTGLFVDTMVGSVGRDHDAHVLRCSYLYDAMEKGTWVPGNPIITVDGVKIPPVLVGDGAYPLRPWLMTPYSGNLAPEEVVYNRAHNRARCIVERAFGHLKGRWRSLLLQLPVMEENLNCIICSCIILHNICELRGHCLEDRDVSVNPNGAQDEEDQPLDYGNHQQREGERVHRAITTLMMRRRRR